MEDVNKTTDSVDLTSSEVNIASQTKAEIDKIYSKYWHSEMTGQEFKVAIQSIVQAAELRARISELNKMREAAVSDTVETFTKRHYQKRIAKLTKQAEVSNE